MSALSAADLLKLDYKPASGGGYKVTLTLTLTLTLTPTLTLTLTP